MINDRDLSNTMASNNEPIFILGIMPRSGTHFLYDLLLLHPDCGSPDPIWGDYFIQDSDLLINYANKVSRNWRLSQENEERFNDLFCQNLGSGMISFLNSIQMKRRLITKTPGVDNLDNFFKIFPKAYLIILIRDGRSVVESLRKSFGGDYEIAMKRWAQAAETIIQFNQVNLNSGYKYLIVRYEDLYTNLRGELCRILEFLKLDINVYDFNAAANLPVKGSSDLRKLGEKAVHWNPIEKPRNFNPLARSDNWGWFLQERFNHIAGQYLDQFGYENKYNTTHAIYGLVMHFILDIKLSILWRLRRLKHTRLIFHSE